MEKFDVKKRALELINIMSEDQLKDLLKHIEGQKIERRKHPRKKCSISSDCFVKNDSDNGFIKNISAAGAFIETRLSLSVGQQITLAFIPDNLAGGLIKISGIILHSGPRGIGVKFYEEIPDLYTEKNNSKK